MCRTVSYNGFESPGSGIRILLSWIALSICDSVPFSTDFRQLICVRKGCCETFPAADLPQHTYPSLLISTCPSRLIPMTRSGSSLFLSKWERPALRHRGAQNYWLVAQSVGRQTLVRLANAGRRQPALPLHLQRKPIPQRGLSMRCWGTLMHDQDVLLSIAHSLLSKMDELQSQVSQLQAVCAMLHMYWSLVEPLAGHSRRHLRYQWAAIHWLPRLSPEV